MSKKFTRLIILFILSMLLVMSCAIENKETKEHQDISIDKEIKDKKLTQYNIQIEFDPDNQTVSGLQNTIYTNNEDVNLNNIYFHLYPNAFKSKETVPFLFDDFNNAYPNGFSEGYINIEEISVNGDRANYSIEGKGDTILKIQLNQELEPGENITIDMKYLVKLPPATERFGFGQETFNFGNWYPVVAVYDDEGWNIDPYYSIGDPFYSDVANYNVIIEAPEDITIAATGEVVGIKNNENKKNWNISAKAVRDFAWVASKYFKVVESEVDGIKLKNYIINNGDLDEETIDRAVEYTNNSIKTFNKVFGKYPYKEYSVVQTNFPSGMEYPGIVFIGKQYYDKRYKNFLETLIVHETAHQWWYSAVGNDQVDEAWLDESFASYSEVIYYDEIYGESVGEKYHLYENEKRYEEIEDSIEDKSILKALNEFEGWNDYGLLVYTKGAILLDEIKDKYGKDKFYKILNTYYNKYKYEIASTEDFIDICESVTGENLDGFFNKWLKGDEKGGN